MGVRTGGRRLHVFSLCAVRRPATPSGPAARSPTPPVAHLQGGLVASDALLADSSPTGRRSGLFTAQFAASEAAQWLGVALVGVYLGPEEAQAGDELRGCLLLGSLLAVLPALLVLWLDDSRALGTESAGVLEPGRQPAAQSWRQAVEAAPARPWLAPVRTTGTRGAAAVGSFWIQVDEHDLPSSAGTATAPGSSRAQGLPEAAQLAASHPLVFSPGSTPASPWQHAGPFSRDPAADECQEPGSGAPFTPPAGALQEQQQQQLGPGGGSEQHAGSSGAVMPAQEPGLVAIIASSSPYRCLQPAMAPLYLLLFELTTGLASGLSLSLLPKILRDELHLDSAAVQAVFVKAGLLTCAAAVLAQRASRLVGRAQAILAFNAAGIVLLWLVAGAWGGTSASTITWLCICR
jgi:hypothetical protein